MTLLARIAGILRGADIPHALIGASAMAKHGVVRSTLDQDLLAVEPACLQPKLWSGLQSSGVEAEIRKGDFYDPLLGVVRFSAPGERPVDLVVGKFTWQREIIARATLHPGGEVPFVRAVDLILLKLYAGGPQDAWDIHQLLAAEDRETLIAQVDQELTPLPDESALLWRKILDG